VKEFIKTCFFAMCKHSATLVPIDDLLFAGVCAVLLMIAVTGMRKLAQMHAEAEDVSSWLEKQKQKKPLRPGEWAHGRQVHDGARMLSVQSGRAVDRHA
jgi:hypothetical protein